MLLSETKKLLKRIKNFVSTEEDTIVSFVIDLSSLLSVYKECSSYDKLEEEVRNCVDLFILDEIILKVKLSSDEYFRLKGFIKRINELFNFTMCEIIKGSNCLEYLFDERIYTDDISMYDKIKMLYQ